MTDRKKLIEKIRKLLALAGSSNEHEAALAAERAQDILAEYNLSMSDVDEASDDGEIETDDEIVSESRPWRRSLGMVVAELYFCDYFFDFKKIPTPTRKCGYIRKDIHCFIGAPHNIIIAKLMFTYLLDTVERLARNGSLQHPAKERTSYMTSFKIACALRLCERIYDRIQQAKAGQVKTSDGSNLPALADLYDQVRMMLDQYKAKHHPGLRPTKVRITENHSSGVLDGKRAGNEIGLETQLDKTSSNFLIGKQ